MKAAELNGTTFPPEYAPTAGMVCFSLATLVFAISLVCIYVLLPFLGLLEAPPASYGILMAISIYFAADTLLHPVRALLHAPLFMLLATAFVPQSFVIYGGGAPPEYYFWATGLLFITSALVLRLPWETLVRGRKRIGVPFFLIAFSLVCVAASLQGLRLGFGASYVARQLFGALLFIIYFCAALVLPKTRSEIVKYFDILKWVGITASLFTIIIDTPSVSIGDMGTFKWGLSIYCAMLAVYCVAGAATAKGLKNRVWLGVQALILIANPIVFQARAATGFAALASGLAFVALIKSNKMKVLLTVGALAIAIGAIVAGLILPVDSFLPQIGNAAHLVPRNILKDPSYIGRVNELLSALQVVKAHPFLGAGLGSALTFFDTTVGRVESVVPIDQGFAYLLSKLGLLGLVSFYALVFSVFRRSGWPKRNLLHISTFVLFFFCIGFMLSHPDMLQFIVASFSGMISGLLCREGTLRTRAGPAGLARGQRLGGNAGFRPAASLSG
jgi:hypothetical protein